MKGREKRKKKWERWCMIKQQTRQQNPLRRGKNNDPSLVCTYE
jgi:hypothetical protein